MTLLTTELYFIEVTFLFSSVLSDENNQYAGEVQMSYLYTE